MRYVEIGGGGGVRIRLKTSNKGLFISAQLAIAFSLSGPISESKSSKSIKTVRMVLGEENCADLGGALRFRISKSHIPIE